MASDMAIGETKRQALVAKVLPPEEWKLYLNNTSNVAGFTQLFFHLGCAAVPALGIYYARNGGPFLLLIPSLIALGFVSSFYFTAFHEIIHCTAFSSKLVQKVLSYPIGFAVFRGPNWFWAFHWLHHRYTQDPDLDPELSGSSADLMDPSKSVCSYLRFMSGWPFGFERVLKMASFKMHKDRWVVSSGTEKPVLIETIIFLICYLACAVGAVLNEQVREAVVLYWLIPHCIGAGHLRFYQFCEHRGCEFGRYTELDAWGSCRTTKTFWFYSKLAWNMPFHIEHHSWPAVPFYLLPKLRERIREGAPEERCLFNGVHGYTGVHAEFLRRVRKGEPTALPRIEATVDENGHQPAAIAHKRTMIINDACDLGTFPMSEVCQHKTHQDCWLVIDGLVIDATTFMPEHPGGEMVLAEKAGKDVSKIFRMIHPEGTLEKRLPQHCIKGTLEGSGLARTDLMPLTEPLLS